MSTNQSVQPCPRCGTPRAAEMPFCRTCGWQFAPGPLEAAPSGAPASEFIPYDGPATPESWPEAEPGYPFQNQINYPAPTQPLWPPLTPGAYAPQGQFGPAGYAPAPVVAAPSRRRKVLLLLTLVLVVVLGGAAGGIFWALHASTTTAPIFDRHGLQSNVPLPDNSAFQYKHTVTQGNLTADEWIWKVNNNEPTNLEQFYRNQLPKSGWTHIQTIDGQTIGVLGCQGEQVLIVGISKHLQDNNGAGTPTITDAPTGGSALGIALTSSLELRQSFCQAS